MECDRALWACLIVGAQHDDVIAALLVQIHEPHAEDACRVSEHLLEVAAIAGHGLAPPYAPPPGAALDDPPSPDPPHLRSGLGERGGPPEIVKTANPELFNQLLGGK